MVIAMPNRPTKKQFKDCSIHKKALDTSRKLMGILQDELVEHLDGPKYENEVSTDCDIDPALFENGNEQALADALNEAFEGSSGKCRQSLINILQHRTRGAELMSDMIRTLELIDNRQEEYKNCLHKKP
jgi:hypothetical protein